MPVRVCNGLHDKVSEWTRRKWEESLSTKIVLSLPFLIAIDAHEHVLYTLGRRCTTTILTDLSFDTPLLRAFYYHENCIPENKEFIQKTTS
jgi:hypothetical protein